MRYRAQWSEKSFGEEGVVGGHGGLKSHKGDPPARRGGHIALISAFTVLLALAVVPSAGAAQLVEFGTFGGQAGGAGGEIRDGSGVAVNETGAGGVAPGSVYVADSANARVQEFTGGGAFVRTWGKDVDADEPGTGFEICTAESGHTCQAGTGSAEAGALSYPRGIAIDQDTGNVYVADGSEGAHRISVFSATGTFEGAFGWEVDAGAPAEELQFCTAVTGCQEGKLTDAAGGFGQIYNGALAIDPSNGNLVLGDFTNGRIDEYSFQTNPAEEVIGVSFVRAFGWNVDATAPAEDLQECTALTGCKAGTTGSGEGQLGEFQTGLTVDAMGDIYVVSNAGRCTSTTPCQLMKFNPDGTFGELFGPGSGGDAKCQTNWSDGGLPSGQAATAVAVDPTTQHLFVTRKRTTATYEICEFNQDGELLQSSPAEPVPTGATELERATLTLAVAPGEHVYTLGADPSRASWPVRFFGIVPAAPAVVLPSTDVTQTSAILHGEVTIPKPGGTGFNIQYRFEYAPNNVTTWLHAPAKRNASVGSTVPGAYPVAAPISNLLPNTTYRVRLVTVASSTTISDEGEFRTPVAAPTISNVYSNNADQTSAALGGRINPNGLPTSYRFEWGPTAAYGHVVPAEFDPPIGAGQEPIPVTARIAGLAAGTSYHFRIVAASTAGVSASPDHEVETLNSCGLPAGRCFELVSPPAVGVVGSPGSVTTGTSDMHFQAAATGPGGLAYTVANGLPGATSGAEVLYLGVRGSDGWSSGQLSPPIAERNQTTEGNSTASVTLGLSENLSCGVVATPQVLTSDPGTRPVIEDGGSNLYLHRSDGSYAAITSLPPTNPGSVPGRLTAEYVVVGISDGCRKVVFASPYHYPGIAGSGAQRLYEWDEGVLRSTGIAVGGEPVEATAGGLGTVSKDGSRVYFSSGGAIFVRESGIRTREVSVSETSIPDTDASFQAATPDGGSVFFTATAGLTDESNGTGTDLYQYSLKTEKLTDRSAFGGPGSAEVAGLVGASADGSVVYFAASGELVPGQGPSLAENQQDGTYSIYSASGTDIAYIGTIRAADLPRVSVASQRTSTSWVSTDGRLLLFESSADVTGYASGGAPEAYLFQANASGSGTTVCVSCRQDGQPSVGTSRDLPLETTGVNSIDGLYRPRSLVDANGEARVFFYSPDKLTSGAAAGARNLYEWAHAQVSRLATEPASFANPPFLVFAGASISGADVYLATPEALTWEDHDQRSSVYDARIGGGFQQPPGPPAACSPDTEGSCQGSSGGSPDSPAVGSSSFSGPGNVKAPQKKPHKKKQKKKPHKSQKKKKQQQGHRHGRQAGGKRRASK
ncbi:MAG: NHL repeat-containing protein [Actinobacteria bacterium]|nr:NHL repeat-containing protein [Actinomycetota bacterium]